LRGLARIAQISCDCARRVAFVTGVPTVQGG
jgi:hypothetical protein